MKEKTKTFFKTVMKSGGLFSSDHLSLKAIKKDGLPSEVRVVISKKVATLAVSRNRLRRQIRELFYEMKPQSVQAVFYVKKGVKSISLDNLRKEIRHLVSKL